MIHPVGIVLAWAGLISVAAVADAQTVQAPVETPAVLQLVVNGQTHADMLVLMGDASLWAPADALRAAGLVWQEAASRSHDGARLVALESIRPALSHHIDEQEARLVIQASPDSYRAQVTAGRVQAPSARPRNASAFLNYSGTLLQGGRRSFASELGVRAGGLLVRSTLSQRTGARLVRGATTLTIDDERRLVRWELGDSVAEAPFGGGATFVAGVTVARQFGIQPQFLRIAPESVRGATSVPAVAEIYVNGQLVSRQDVAPGAFEVRDIALPVGAGDVELVLRDDFGRVQRASTSFYRSPRVLRQGLHEFRYTAGSVRRETLDSLFSYGELIGVAEHRVGVTAALTVGGTVQLSRENVTAGASLATTLLVGEVEVGAWTSRAEGRGGVAWSAAYGYRGRRFSVGASARHASRGFTEYRGAFERAPRWLEADVSASVRIARAVSLHGRYVVAEQRSRARVERSTISSSLRVARGASLSAGILTNPATAGRQHFGAQATLHVSLGGVTAASAGVFRAPDGSRQAGAALQRSLPIGPGVGYRVQVQDGPATRGSAALELQGGPGRLEVRADGGWAGAASAITASGALSVVGGRLHLSRPIHDAFALVRVPGIDGVRTYLSNQYVGRTDARGELLVPSLASYVSNRIEVDDRDVPFEYDMPRTLSLVAPAYRAGGIVAFDLRRTRLVNGRFVLPDLVPAGDRAGVTAPAAEWLAEARWSAGAERIRIGSDGGFFLEYAEPGRHDVIVSGTDTAFRCQVVVDPAADPLAILNLGLVPCTTIEPDGGRGGR